jgi:hypothetical protein
MRTGKEKVNSPQELGDANPDTDNYPPITQVIRTALDHEDFPQGDVARLEINCLSNGQGTWRAWVPGADFPEGGVYSPTGN